MGEEFSHSILFVPEGFVFGMVTLTSFSLSEDSVSTTLDVYWMLSPLLNGLNVFYRPGS